MDGAPLMARHPLQLVGTIGGWRQWKAQNVAGGKHDPEVKRSHKVEKKIEASAVHMRVGHWTNGRTASPRYRLITRRDDRMRGFEGGHDGV